MKRFASPFSRRSVLLPVAGLCLLLTEAGCGHASQRPASSLSERDRTTLNGYEQIRAALATDDLHAAKTAANELAAHLKPADARAPAPAALAPAEGVANAVALDRARQGFARLSTVVIPLAQGVEGFYVMTSPMPSAGDWVQQKPQVDNPYFGKDLHTSGELKK